MTDDAKIPSSLFKEGKYQREYQKYIDYDDFENQSARRWIENEIARNTAESKLAELEELEAKRNSEISNAAYAKHYKNVAFGFQFAQLVVELVRDLPPEEAALLSHVHKYTFRLNRKDDSIIDAEKAIQWLKIYIEYKKGEGGGRFEMPEELK